MANKRDAKKRELITRAEYARRSGVSRANVTKLVKKGVIKLYGPDELVDPAQADKARRQNTSPGQVMGGNAKLPGSKKKVFRLRRRQKQRR
jgi:hypothetical protein